jgi:hypothetical protein
MRAIKVFGNSDLLDRQDVNRKFANKLAAARKDYANDPTPFTPHARCAEVAEFLFPELGTLS